MAPFWNPKRYLRPTVVAAVGLGLALFVTGCGAAPDQIAERVADLGYTCWDKVPPEHSVTAWKTCQNDQRQMIDIITYSTADAARLSVGSSASCAEAVGDDWIVSGDVYQDVATVTKGLSARLLVPTNAPHDCGGN